jgi:hypothetical protein
MSQKREERVGMKTVGNGRENSLTVPTTAFFGRERESRTGKRKRYYGISGTKYFDREHVNYDQESITQNGNTTTCYHFKHLA